MLERHDVAHLRADNPSPFTLTGTNTYVVGRGAVWIVDPGPALDAHLDAIAAEVARRGRPAGIVLTHDHRDHAEGVPGLRARLGGDVPVAAVRHPAEIPLADGDTVGPFRVLATPGHAEDHVAYIYDSVLFSGDAVLGEGSVFVAPHPGALRGYLAALERILADPPALIAPGHGPLVTDPRAKIEQYVAHRRERERRLLAALDAGRRTVDELLDEAWSDTPESLRFAAAITLAAHLDKLEEEGRLPDGVERPAKPDWLTSASV